VIGRVGKAPRRNAAAFAQDLLCVRFFPGRMETTWSGSIISKNPFACSDHHIAPPNEHKFRMGHRVLPAVRCANDERARASEVMSNKLVIHDLPFSIPPREVNLIRFGRC
jgi:hypothetical protein